MRESREFHYFDGRWRTLTEIARICGMNPATLHNRVSRSGMTLEDAINRPVGSKLGKTARTLEFHGVQKTVKEIAALTGRSITWVRRHSNGVTIIDLPDKRAYFDLETHPHLTTYFHAGVKDTLSGWSRRTGIHRSEIKCRLQNGWPLARALTAPMSHRKANAPITFEGRTMAMADWAKEAGITLHALHTRLRVGWPLDRALTTPSRKGRKQ